MIKLINKKIFNWEIIVFFVAILLALLSSINTLYYTNDFYHDLKIMYEKDWIGQNHIQIARVYLLYSERELNHLLLAKSIREKETALSNISRFKQNFTENINIAEPLYYGTNGKRIINEMKDVYNEYFRLVDSVAEHHSFSIENREIPALKDLMLKFDQLDNLLNKLDDLKQEKDLRIYKKIIDEQEYIMTISVLVLIGTIIFRIIILIQNKKRDKSNSCPADVEEA